MADNFLEKRQETYDEKKRKWLQSQKRFPVNKAKINDTKPTNPELISDRITGK